MRGSAESLRIRSMLPLRAGLDDGIERIAGESTDGKGETIDRHRGNETVRSLWTASWPRAASASFSSSAIARDETRSYTYRAFNEEINRAANVFLSMGVERGERVAVQLCTCPGSS